MNMELMERLKNIKENNNITITIKRDNNVVEELELGYKKQKNKRSSNEQKCLYPKVILPDELRHLKQKMKTTENVNGEFSNSSMLTVILLPSQLSICFLFFSDQWMRFRAC